MSSPAAWHPDPTGKHDHRWWDGTHWTEHVADAGEAKVDHLPPGDAPPPPAGGDPTQQSDSSAGDAGFASGPTTDHGDAGSPATGAAAGAAWQQPGGAGTGSGTDQPAWQQDAGSGSQPGYGQAQPGQYGQSDYGQTAAQPGQYGQGDHGQAHAQPGQYGQQPPAWDNGGQQYTQPQSTDGVAIAALVVGIVSLLTSWFLLGGLGGIIALVLGIVAMGRIKRNRSKGRGMAITGIVTGVLAILVAVLMVVVFGRLFGDAAAQYEQCLEENPREVCDEQLERTFMDRFGG